jgi:hypothetical protein
MSDLSDDDAIDDELGDTAAAEADWYPISNPTFIMSSDLNKNI